MRKRSYILLMAMATCLLLGGCAKSEDLSGDDDDKSNVITFANTSTRALKDSFAVGDSFAVWGAMTNATESVEIFNGTEVEQVSAGNWTYSPERYWFDGWEYHFAALWPHDVANVEYDVEDKSLTITNFNTTNNTDLLMAKRTGITYDPEYPTVALEFEHMLAKVSFNGKSADDGHTLTITNINFEGSAQASFDGTTWTQGSAAAILANYSTSTTLNETGQTLISDILVVPGAIDSKMGLVISYNVDGTVRPNREILLNSASLESLEAGKSYTYTFTLDPSGYIIFNKPTVEPWGSIYGGTFVVDPDSGSNT